MPLFAIRILKKELSQYISIIETNKDTLLITREPPKRSQSSFGVVMLGGRTFRDFIAIPDIFLKMIYLDKAFCTSSSLPRITF